MAPLNTLEWHQKPKLPRYGGRVIVYSPDYEGKDNSMLYRIIDAQFVRIATDVEYWAYLILILPIYTGA